MAHTWVRKLAGKQTLETSPKSSLETAMEPRDADNSKPLPLGLWQCGLAEFIAAFLFIFIGAGTVVVTGQMSGGEMDVPRLFLIAAIHGLAITALVYATINISGAHINPAVTFCMLIAGQIPAARAAAYWAAQLGGAALGALLLLAVVPGAADTTLGAHAVGPGVSWSAGLITEAVLTFALVFVIFATAVDSPELRRFAPIAIGLTVLVTNVFGIPISGASLNPARSFGPALIAWEWSHHWIYWAGPIAGGALAALGYQWLYKGRRS